MSDAGDFMSGDPDAVDYDVPGATNGHDDRDNAHRDTTTDPGDIDWQALWDEFDIPPGKPLYRAQMSLLLEASEQTPAFCESGQAILRRALDDETVPVEARGDRYLWGDYV